VGATVVLDADEQVGTRYAFVGLTAQLGLRARREGLWLLARHREEQPRGRIGRGV